MSHVILGNNKLICFIQLPQEYKQTNKNQFLHINQLTLVVYHFHYPCVYYQKVFKHYQHYLPSNTTYLQIRFIYNGKQLPSDLPIGLFIQNNSKFIIKISQFQISQPYQLIKQQWKQAFTGINPVRGNYYIFKQLGQPGVKKKLELYFRGQSHALQKQQFEGYEGTNIVTRFVIQGQIIQRKSEVNENKTIKDLIRQQMPILKSKNYKVKSHGVDIDLGMNIKQFLDEWSYNDGYCYLKINIIQ